MGNSGNDADSDFVTWYAGRFESPQDAGGKPAAAAGSAAAAPRPDPRAAVGLDFYHLPSRLLHVSQVHQDTEKAFHEMLKLVLSMTSAAEVIYFRRDADNQLAPGPRIRQHWFQAKDTLYQQLAQWSDTAVQSDRAEVQTTQLDARLTALCAVVARPGRSSEALCVVASGVEQLPHLSAVAQLVASFMTLRQHRDYSEQADREAANAAALVELVSRIQAYERIRPACFAIANELQAYLGCLRVVVAYGKGQAGQWRIQAISGMPDFDARSELVHAVSDVMHEAVIRNDLSVWPVADRHRQAMLAHGKLAELAEVDSVVSIPLRDAQHHVVGVWVLLGDDQLAHDHSRLNMIRASAPHVTACLQFVERNQRGLLWRIARSLWQHRNAARTRIIVALLLVSVFVLLLPMPYRVAGDAQLQPVTRRVVAAPFEAILERALVEPGDVVSADQQLAQLDGREIRWELAGLLAEYDRAETERRVALARRDPAATRQAELTLDRLDLKIQLFRHRAANLEIRSPIRGVVLTGDLEKAQGMPVSKGQLLFEIGPLDQMVVEIAVPDDDVPYVQPGSQIQLRLDSDPTTAYASTVVRVHPQAEVIDGQNVFIAEAVLDNPAGLLRPGMRGTAKVTGPRRPLIWNLLHKPWQYFTSHFGAW
jgi:hypothetical protein